MSQIVTEMVHGVTMTAMMEEETAIGIAMTTETAGTMTEEVWPSACSPDLLSPSILFSYHFSFLLSF